MKTTIFFWGVASLALSTRLAAADPHNIDCIVQMQLPIGVVSLSGEPIGFGETFEVVPEGGSVEITQRDARVEVSIALGGTIKDIQIVSSSKGTLNRDLEKHLREHLSLKPECSGKTVTIEFVFRFGGTVRQRPLTQVSFLYPNKFVIEQEPGVAIVYTFE